MEVFAQFAGSAVGVIVSLAGWFLVKREVEKNDQQTRDLQSEVKELREIRVSNLEGCVKENTREISDVRAKFVHKKECAEFREAMVTQLERFNDSTLKLERTSERVDMTMKRQEKMFDQLISAQGQIAATVAQVENLKEEMNHGQD
mgnify:CR=1 FL=1